MTNHFNQLAEAEQERLSILIEECGEVIQSACKILRHGYESRNPTIENGPTNRKELEVELGHVISSIKRMENAEDVSTYQIINASIQKDQKIARYLHHQESH